MRSRRPWGLLSAGAAALFAGLSRVRGKRIFHPRGSGWIAVATVSDVTALPWKGSGKQIASITRLSRGLGLPSSLPDILGIAIRIPDVAPGVGQDLLLASSARGRLGRHVLVPRKDFRRAWFSSVLPYRTDDGIVVFGASITKQGRGIRTGAEDLVGVRFDLFVASMGRPWEQIGTVQFEERLDAAATESLRFNPWNTHPGLEPAGPLNGLRRGAYVGSQEGRPT